MTTESNATSTSELKTEAVKTEELKISERPPRLPYRIDTFVSTALLFTSFLLFLLVALSLPIIKPIYLLSFKSTTPVAQQPRSLATELRFGVWGVCATSTLNPATALTNPGPCFGPMLGYTVPPELAAAASIPPAIISVVQDTLIVIPVLHPIAAGLALISLVLALLSSTHAQSIVILISTVTTSLVSSVALAIDIALVMVAKRELTVIVASLQFEIGFGNGVWMILGAVVSGWLGVVTLSMKACYCLGRYHRRRRRHHHHHSPEHY